MHFLPEQLTGLPEASDRRGRVRQNPSAIAYLDVGEGNGGIVLNVSETGIAIAVAQALTDDEIPSLSFRLPQLDRTFQAGGQVVWRSATNKTAGVRFVNLEERDRSQIRNWIRAEIVEHELKAPMGRAGESSAESGAAASQAVGAAAAPGKTVIVMPSRAARKAADEIESEAERDEARAAEFDRMFPSEAELANLALAEDGASLGPVTGSDAQPELFEPADHADVEQAAEAFLAAHESETEEAPAVENAASAAVVEPAEQRDWREQWEQFHLEREKLEKFRSSETGWELPRPFSAPLPEDAIAFTEIPVADAPLAAEQALAEPVVQVVPPVVEKDLSPTVNAGKPPSQKIPARGFGDGLSWYRAPIGAASDAVGVADAGVTRATLPKAAKSASQSRANPPKTEKDALSIAALCVMLVLMCFILGYAIQPGSFRFSTLKNWVAAREAAEAVTTPQVQPVSEQIPSSANAPAAAMVTPEANTPVPGVPPATPVATESVEPKTPAPAIASTPRVASDAAPHVSNAATPAPAVSHDNATAPRASSTPAPLAAAAPASTLNDVTIDAPVPVSFFPVTAPAEGSPAKLMQLPEETILQTRDIVIRSHQFLFVPPLPGPEATHELERVHLGDRIAKIDPAFVPQAVEQFKGSSIHLRSTIGADGKVADVQAISGPTTLIPTAVNAVRQWRYKPTDIDGKPIAIEEDIVIEVRPSHS